MKLKERTSQAKTFEELEPQELKSLSSRWDKVTLQAQCSPLEDFSISALAKNAASRPWSSYTSTKGDTLARYIYLSFEELHSVEKLDLKAATHLLEICEATLVFEEACSNLGSFDGLDSQATKQRLRFLGEFGLHQDYPIKLSNLDPEILEMCQAEGANTLIDLMGFIDRLAERSRVGGEFKNLQNIFAHGDEQGLYRYFPYRMGHRGLHLPEALSICLERLSDKDLAAVFEYHGSRQKKSWFSIKQTELPAAIESQIIPLFFQCLHYFGQRQTKLLEHLYDSDYLFRELMFLKDPRREELINWLLNLTLSIFQPTGFENVDQELKQIKVDEDTEHYRDLEQLTREAFA